MTKFMFCAKVLLKFSVHQYGHSVRMQFEKYKDMFNRTNQGHEYKLFTFQKHNRANKYTAILHAPMGKPIGKTANGPNKTMELKGCIWNYPITFILGIIKLWQRF